MPNLWIHLWICKTKLLRSAIFCHLTVASQERFPSEEQWGPLLSPCSTKSQTLWRQTQWVILALWQADKPCQGVHKSSVIISSVLVLLKLRYPACRPEQLYWQLSWLSLPLCWRYIHSLLSVFELHFPQILRQMILFCPLLIFRIFFQAI